jgi:hypothetical protein
MLHGVDDMYGRRVLRACQNRLSLGFALNVSTEFRPCFSVLCKIVNKISGNPECCFLETFCWLQSYSLNC